MQRADSHFGQGRAKRSLPTLQRFYMATTRPNASKSAMELLCVKTIYNVRAVEIIGDHLGLFILGALTKSTPRKRFNQLVWPNELKRH